MLVAHDDARAVGHLAVTIHSEYGAHLGMMVAPDYRGRGLGRRLLQEALTWAQKRGFPALSLLVFAHNDAAIRLYRSCGFADVAYFENDVVRKDGQRWDTILMTRVLDAGQKIVDEASD